MRVEELLSKLRPVIGEDRANSLWLLYSMAENWEKKNEIEGMINALAASHLDEFFFGEKILLPPPKSLDESGLLLGTIHYGDEVVRDFHLPERSLLEHMGVFGATGTGKTNLGFLLVRQLLAQAIPFTAYSWKREYRCLLSSEWPGSNTLKVFTVGRDVAPFSFNPFEPPPRTSAEIWAEKIVDVMSHAYFLGHGVRYLLHQALSNLGNPSPESLLRNLRWIKATGRKRQWLDSALRAAGDLCIGPAGRAFSGNPRMAVDTLLQSQAVLELDALGEDAKTFFVEALLAWIHQFRLTDETRGKLLHVNLLEEAHRLILKRSNFEAETVIDMVFREIRELGESIVAFDQNLSMISKPALGNMGTTLLFRQKHGDDLRAGADAVLLDATNRQWLGRLPTGWAIAKTADREGPFLLQIPFVQINRAMVADEDVRNRFLGYSESNKKPVSFQAAEPVIPPIPTRDKKEVEGQRIGEEETKFLLDVMMNSTGVVERYQRLGISRSRGNAIKTNLTKGGMIQETSVAAGKCAIKYLQLTEKGRQTLSKHGVDVSTVNLSGNQGGPEHRYWVNRISDELERAGFTVARECPLPEGGFADIVVKEINTAIEVETGKSDAVENVTKNLRSKFDRVIVVSTSAQERRKIIEELRAMRSRRKDAA